MGANKTPIDKSMTKEKAIKQGGYYNTDGDWNCIVVDKNYPDKILRGRVEVLILKDGKLFMYRKENGDYRIPGGGFDKGVSNIDQAFMETKEEAKIIIDNIKYSGVSYVRIYDEIWKHSDNDIPEDGTFNEVYIAKYKKDYHGYIRKGLSDMQLTNKGDFYDLDEIQDILKEPHRQALMNILNGTVTESTGSDLIITAQQFQKTLMQLHNENLYTFINNIDIEPVNEGYIFAQYNTNNSYEENKVKRFVEYCNAVIENTIYTGVVEEPLTYKGNGFLYIKPEMPFKNKDNEFIANIIQIDESSIFKNNFVYNLDDFIDNKSNILLITGLSGSGKTTMAYDLADEYNAKVIQLDYFQNFNLLKDKYKNDLTIKLINEYLENNVGNNISYDITLNDYELYFRPFFFWLLEKLKSQKGKYIIEGIHIILFTKFEDVKYYPLICLETSKTVSIIRHWIRDEWKLKDIIARGYKDIILFNKWDQKKKDFFKESSATNGSSNDKYPIFIINTYTGTPFGKIIKTYTHSNYTHSGISLDASLENIYSFNGDNGVNKAGGFSNESLSSYVKYNNDCQIQVNCIFVNKDDIKKIKDKLNYLERNQKYTKYGFNNLLNIIVNRATDMSKDAMSMVCSQFVSYILSIADIKLLDKSANLTTPKDLSSLNIPTVYRLYEGYGREYDKKKIDRIFRKLKIKSHLVKDN